MSIKIGYINTRTAGEIFYSGQVACYLERIISFTSDETRPGVRELVSNIESEFISEVDDDLLF